MKRGFDFLIAAVLLVLLSPVLLATALAVRLAMGSPVLLRQIRPGLDGQPFAFLKFRSMTEDRDASGELLPDAQRMTPFGAWLRRSSLDELPQLINVLRGDMSLVGPRPPIPYEARHYRAWHLRRLLQLKPGITGPWQVSGRSQVPFDDMVRMDLRYIARSSLGLDLLLLARTVGVVFSGRGAR